MPLPTKAIIAALSLVICSAVMVPPGPVQAIGVGVSPHELEVEVHPSGLVNGSISVVNTSEEESLYQVYIEEGALSSWFHIGPREFVLEPGGYQKVQIDISPPEIAPGEYETKVCVVGLIHTSELKVGCGVKVPVLIRVLPLGLLGKVSGALPGELSGTALLVIIISVATPVAAVVFLRRRRKSHAA